MSAVISHCKKYRWILRRRVAGRMAAPRIQEGYILWVMLNPSTANETEDDATIRRCMSFSRGWGFREMVVVNLYGFRATDPGELTATRDAVGVENDAWVFSAAQSASRVVLAWGSHAEPHRAKAVVDILTVDNPVLYCLGTNQDGSPKHPLYLAGRTPLEIWETA